MDDSSPDVAPDVVGAERMLAQAAAERGRLQTRQDIRVARIAGRDYVGENSEDDERQHHEQRRRDEQPALPAAWDAQAAALRGGEHRLRHLRLFGH